MSKIKKILITGGSGMLGKNIRDAFQNTYYEILAPTHAELDLLCENDVLAWMDMHKPDLVIHCAGLVGGIQANINNPISFFVNNMRIGLNIIMGAFQNGVKFFLNLASSCMYPANFDIPLKEEMILSGLLEPTNEGYALAKCSATRLCQYISQEYPDFSYKTIIPCNLYGKYDKFDSLRAHMIPSIIQKIDYANSNNISIIEIWGDGQARREFMYAGDLATLVLMAVSKFDILPNLMNAGLGYDYNVDEYYQRIGAILGYSGSFIHNLSKPSGMRRKLLDITLQKEFGFKPRHTLEEGVRKTYEWYKSI